MSKIIKRFFISFNSLFIEHGRLDTKLEEYLLGIRIKNYEDITGELEILSKDNLKIWVSPFSSYAIYNAVTNKVNLNKIKYSLLRIFVTFSSNKIISTLRQTC